jgi:hypothetical protein
MAIGRITGQMLSANLARSGTDLTFETNLLALDVTNSRIGIGTASPATTLHISATDAIRLPSGSTAQRPGSPANGDIRYNSDTGQVEGYAGSAWAVMTGGTQLFDADGDTVVSVERTADEDQIHFQVGGTDAAHIRSNGNIELNNLQIADMTISTLSTNGDLTLTPNGTGKVIVTNGTTLQTNTADINGGAIDGTVIGANSAAAGTFTTIGTSGNVTVGGDLTVNGTTTTVATTNTTIEDNIIELNSGISASSNDAGILIERGSTGDNAFIGWDESADKFTVGTTTATAGDKSGGITVTKGTLVADLEGDVTGDVTGTVSDISNHLLDEDNMATDSATKAPSQQSVKAYVDAQDANIAGDTLTFTNKTIDANGTGNNISNIDSGNFLSGFFLDEDNMASDDATAVASQQSIKAYVDAQDANIAGDTLTFTNKTFDANGTGNSISNIETADFASAAFKDEDNMASDSDTAVASQQSIKAYVDAQDANIASDTLTFTNKTFDANGTGNSISNIEVADFAGTAIITVAETLASNDSDTALVTAGAIIDYVDAQDANIASDTLTLTNKTFDANGTGNSITNIEVADFASGVLDTDISSVSASDDTLASAKAIKTYVDAQVSAVSTTSISEGNSSVDVDDGAGGAGQVIVAVDGNTELVINDTSATFSGNVIMSGDLTVNGTTTTVATTNTTVADNIIELNSGISASSNDAGILIERGSTGDNAFIGWDESEDKFTVGTTTATAGDKSGGITVTKGTLVADLEGDVTGDVTGTVSDISNHLLDEDNMATDSATKAPSQQSVKAYVDAQDANIASDTLTFTNKTFDANGTGNSLSNVEVADFASGVVDTDISSVSASDDTLASAKAIKSYVDAQVTAQDLDFTADDSTTNSIDLDSEVMQFSGGTGITTSATGNTVTTSIDSTVTTNTGTQTLTNKTFDANGTGNSITNIEVADFAGTAIITVAETLASNDSDTALVTAGAIIDYVDAQDANIAGDTLTLTNKTFDANGTGNSITNIEVADFAGPAIINVAETLASNDSDTALVTAGAIIDYVDAQDANVASDTLTFTNKTFDANGTGNSLSNVQVADFASGEVLDEDNMASDSATKLATQQSIKAYVDTAISAVSTTTIAEGNSSVDVDDGAGGAGQVVVTVDGNTELTINDTSATFSGNVVISGDMTINGTTTTIDSTTLTVEDPLIQLAKNNSGGDANTFDQGLFFNRGSLDNVSFIWDESADQFAFAVTSGEDGTTAGNITIDSYANVKANVITGADVETGTISAADGTQSATIANSTGVMTIASAVLTTADINGGTIDGATIGGATPAAGTFTNLTANGTIDIDSTGNMDGIIIGANTAAAGTFTTATATNVQATNIKANDGTAAIVITDSTGAVAVSTALTATGNVSVNGGTFIFNEAGADLDFRFEGDNNANLLFGDAGNDRIGIKTATPGYTLDIGSATDGILLPSGNTEARPTATAGIIRFNSQSGQYEGSQDGSTYVNFAIAGAAPTFTKETTTGDGSTTTFSGFFSTAPESANNVFVYIDNVYQEPTENYTVSGTDITFTSAPHSGARIFAITGADGTALVTGGIARSETTAVSVSGSSATNIFTFSGSTYRSAECFITVQDSGNTQYSAMKATVIHDGTTAYGMTYAVTNTAAQDIVDLSFNYNGGTIEVKATPLNSGTQSIKVQYSLASV